MRIIQNEPLSKYTTFHLGGDAKYFYVAENIDELKEALKFAKEKNLPYFILGGGSNLIVDGRGYKGLVIKISNFKFKISNKYYIEVDAGVNLAAVVKESLDSGLVGLEWAYGIPGTIGGAVYGNAGAYGGEMKDSIKSVKVFRDGKTVGLKNKDCKFGYRESIFKKNNDIILSAKIRLKEGSEEELKKSKEKIEKIKKERKEKFTNGFSAGSFFKNVLMNKKEISNLKNKFSDLPDQFVKNKMVPAAWLIDQCDLKGFCIGNVCVSEKHAGILINKGKGKNEELSQLVSLIKTKVRDRFGIQLMEEVCYLM